MTGEPIAARRLYAQAASFRCRAQHVFATNTLPPFGHGMDAGVRRRLLPVAFNRTIPQAERIPDLGRLIARQEGDLVFAIILTAAKRLLARRRFEVPPSSRGVLHEWIQFADPISAWLEDEEAVAVTGNASDRPSTQELYAGFCAWAQYEGLPKIQLPQRRIFTSRLKAMGVPKLRFTRHATRGNVVEGLRLVMKGRRA